MRKLSSINEGLFTSTVRRGYTDEKRKEDVVKIIYHPETLDELKKIIYREIGEQGGINIDLRMIDVSKINKANYAFFSYGSIKSLNISNWDVSNIKDMEGMFYGCSSIKSLDISNWDVSKVNTMENMFYGCKSLQTLDISNWDVSKVKDMGYIFYDCESLQSLDLSNWNISNLGNIFGSFDNCPIKYEKQGNKLVRIHEEIK